MRKQIFIRADGDPHIGLGHLYRSLALAEMLGEDFQTCFVCKAAPGQFLEEITQKGIDYRLIEDESGWINDLKPADIVILDGYSFNYEYHVSIRSHGARLVCIDDLHNQKFQTDLIINHATEIQKSDYDGSEIERFALGPEYALLRPVFIEQAQRSRQTESIMEVFVCFGGADKLNLGSQVVRFLLEHTLYRVVLVLGASNLATEGFDDVPIENRRRLRIESELNEHQMKECMLQADLGIVPSSSILFECIACKLPVLSGYYVDNQRLIYEGFKEKKCILDAGDFRNADWQKKILNINMAELSGIIKQQASTIDGNSAARLKVLFQELN